MVIIVVATNTKHIDDSTKYTTLQHVPRRRAGFGAVGSLVADQAFKPGSLRKGRPYYEQEIEG